MLGGRTLELHAVLLGAAVLLWYALNTSYGFLSRFPAAHAPIILAGVHFLMGCIPAVLQPWRSMPDFLATCSNLRSILLAPPVLLVSAAHYLGTIMTIFSLGHGSVAITYMVKALEPVSTVLLSMALEGTVYPLRAVIWFIPACAGMLLVTLHRASGHAAIPATPATATFAAITANFSFSFRNVMIKSFSQLHKREGAVPAAQGFDLASADGLLVMSLHGIALTLSWQLVALALPCPSDSLASLGPPWAAATSLVFPSAAHAGYQVCSFCVLRAVPVAVHSLLNGLKRSLPVLLGTLLDRQRASASQWLGIALTLGGVTLFYRELERAQASEQVSHDGREPDSLMASSLANRGTTAPVQSNVCRGPMTGAELVDVKSFQLIEAAPHACVQEMPEEKASVVHSGVTAVLHDRRHTTFHVVSAATMEDGAIDPDDDVEDPGGSTLPLLQKSSHGNMHDSNVHNDGKLLNQVLLLLPIVGISTLAVGIAVAYSHGCTAAPNGHKH